MPRSQYMSEFWRLRQLKFSRGLAGYFVIAPAIILLLVLTVYPVFRTLQLSVMTMKSGEWFFVGLEHYAEVLRDKWFWNSVSGLLRFTIPALILHIFLGMGFALLLNETWFNTTFRNFVRGLLILPWVFSTAASALMWALLLHNTGPINFLAVRVFDRGAPIPFLAGNPELAMGSLVAVNTWLSYPFVMVMILGGLQGIPAELYEAAKVDGANAWKRFRYVTIPSLRTTLIAVTTIDLIWTCGQLDLVHILTRGGPLRRTETVAFYIYKTGLFDGDLWYGSAISAYFLFALAIITIVYVKTLSIGSESNGTRV